MSQLGRKEMSRGAVIVLLIGDGIDLHCGCVVRWSKGFKEIA